jgi:hypothetical protein
MNEPATNSQNIPNFATVTTVAKDINDYLNHYVSVADAKAGALAAMAALTTAIPSLFVGDHPPHLLQWVVKFSILLHIATLSLCGLVVYPRKPSRGDGVVFWEDIATNSSPSAYQQKFFDAIQNNFGPYEYSAQNYYISKVLSKKYWWLRRALCLYAAAVTSISLTFFWPICAK